MTQTHEERRKSAIETLLFEIDVIAQNVDHYDYEPPLSDKHGTFRMRRAVADAWQSFESALRESLPQSEVEKAGSELHAALYDLQKAYGSVQSYFGLKPEDSPLVVNADKALKDSTRAITQRSPALLSPPQVTEKADGVSCELLGEMLEALKEYVRIGDLPVRKAVWRHVDTIARELIANAESALHTTTGKEGE